MTLEQCFGFSIPITSPSSSAETRSLLTVFNPSPVHNLPSRSSATKSKTVLDFNVDAVKEFQKLLQQKVKTGTQDLKIAAIALSVDATIVTRNQRDFQRVPGLRIEDWSI